MATADICSKALLPALLAALACGREHGGAESSGVRSTAGATAPAGPTQASEPDPCSFLTRAQAESILGPLKQDPVRVKDAESLEPDAKGRACSFHPIDRGGRRDENVRLEVATHDGLEFEVGTRAAVQATSAWVPGHATGDTAVAGPWDAAARVAPYLFTARQGDAAVQISVRWLGVKDGKVDSLAAKALANIPDVPVAAPPSRGGDDGGPSALDPCGVLQRGEAEAVIGKLLVPPYRSRTSTSMAEAAGGSCSYRTGHHRVLVVSPTWEGGADAFKLTSLVGGIVGTKLQQGQEADTLDDGPWDRSASDPSGTLLLLKRDALLELRYRTSSTDLAGAVKLARVALGRM